MKFSKKNLLKKTPEAAKSISDAIAWGFGAGGIFVALLLPYPKIALVLAFLGCFTKAVVNFLADE